MSSCSSAWLPAPHTSLCEPQPNATVCARSSAKVDSRKCMHFRAHSGVYSLLAECHRFQSLSYLSILLKTNYPALAAIEALSLAEKEAAQASQARIQAEHGLRNAVALRDGALKHAKDLKNQVSSLQQAIEAEKQQQTADVCVAWKLVIAFKTLRLLSCCTALPTSVRSLRHRPTSQPRSPRLYAFVGLGLPASV
jgi:hypothetical protein